MTYHVFEEAEQVGEGFSTIEAAVAEADRNAQLSPRSEGHVFVVLHAGIQSYSTRSCGPEAVTGIWRGLTPAEVEEFRAWARDNFEPGVEPNPTWHPAVRAEWARLSGRCYIRGDWCLAHDAADTMDHHFDVHPDAFND